MPSQSQVFDTLVTCLGKIKKADGYLTDLQVENVRTGNDPISDLRCPPEQAPRALLLFHGNAYTAMPGHRLTVQAAYSVTVSFTQDRDSADAVTAQRMAENIISDMERMIGLNTQAGGCDLITLENAATDAGYAFPEATVVFELSVQYRKT